MEKRFQLVAAKYNKFVADINAVRDHVGQAHLEMIFDKFTSDSIFDVQRCYNGKFKSFSNSALTDLAC